MANEPLTKDKMKIESAPKLVPIWLEMVSLRNALKDFPNIPAEQWYQFYYYGKEEGKLQQKEEVASAVRLLKEKIKSYKVKGFEGGDDLMAINDVIEEIESVFGEVGK